MLRHSRNPDDMMNRKSRIINAFKLFLLTSTLNNQSIKQITALITLFHLSAEDSSTLTVSLLPL